MHLSFQKKTFEFVCHKQTDESVHTQTLLHIVLFLFGHTESILEKNKSETLFSYT